MTGGIFDFAAMQTDVGEESVVERSQIRKAAANAPFAQHPCEQSGSGRYRCCKEWRHFGPNGGRQCTGDYSWAVHFASSIEI